MSLADSFRTAGSPQGRGGASGSEARRRAAAWSRLLLCPDRTEAAASHPTPVPPGTRSWHLSQPVQGTTTTPQNVAVQLTWSYCAAPLGYGHSSGAVVNERNLGPLLPQAKRSTTGSGC
ncbi:hypothetical protein SKAU_G00247680 [Synaphobranchus kaupii]|uniref:Uncharacterized protein n=1 Tax=Synaphobranchus kaupii TaxID=118154 RepID=A0A9Q1F278_SYNKA|nr:hypothetical protein SKAU_G00247680 [Synaphobranchus kaupii]